MSHRDSHRGKGRTSKGKKWLKKINQNRFWDEQLSSKEHNGKKTSKMPHEQRCWTVIGARGHWHAAGGGWWLLHWRLSRRKACCTEEDSGHAVPNNPAPLLKEENAGEPLNGIRFKAHIIDAGRSNIVHQYCNGAFAKKVGKREQMIAIYHLVPYTEVLIHVLNFIPDSSEFAKHHLGALVIHLPFARTNWCLHPVDRFAIPRPLISYSTTHWDETRIVGSHSRASLG